MHNFACPKNLYEMFLTKLSGQQLVDLKHKSIKNKDVSASGVTTTGNVDILKILKESPLWLPRTSLADLEIMDPIMSSWLHCTTSVIHQTSLNKS